MNLCTSAEHCKHDEMADDVWANGKKTSSEQGRDDYAGGHESILFQYQISADNISSSFVGIGLFSCKFVTCKKRFLA
jgi:hypothetical protein